MGVDKINPFSMKVKSTESWSGMCLDTSDGYAAFPSTVAHHRHDHAFYANSDSDSIEKNGLIYFKNI